MLQCGKKDQRSESTGCGVVTDCNLQPSVNCKLQALNCKLRRCSNSCFETKQRVVLIFVCMFIQRLAEACSASTALSAGTILLGGLIIFCYFRVRQSSNAEPIAGLDSHSSANVRVISRKEVAKHDSIDDLWIILKNQQSNKLGVYNVTAYVEEHPGGQAILNNAGRDSSKGFYGPQHPARVFDMIEDFYIGDLE